MSDRTKKVIIEDTSLYSAAMHIRQYLCDLSGLIPRLNENLNPFYGSTMDGLVVIGYYGGPSKVGTPLGEWSATGGGVQNEVDWLKIATERLGLVELMPETVTGEGCFGPVWGITKDLDGNALPEPKFQMRGLWPGICSASQIMGGSIPEEVLCTKCRELDAYRDPEMPANWSQGEKQRQESYVAEMEYAFSKAQWRYIKKEIGFVAWDDKVDPDYRLETLYSQESLDAHLKTIGYDTPVVLSNDDRVYAMLDNSNKVSRVVVTKYLKGWKVTDILGTDRFGLSRSEGERLAKMLKPRECEIDIVKFRTPLDQAGVENFAPTITCFTGQLEDAGEFVVCAYCKKGLVNLRRDGWMDTYVGDEYTKGAYVHYSCLSLARMVELETQSNVKVTA